MTTDASPPSSPLATPIPWDLVASGYVAENLPLLEPFATQALALVDAPHDAHLVDVATGPGTLAVLAARRGARVSALDFSTAMIERLRGRAAAESLAIDAVVGDGMALPYADGTFAAGFSMFGLMFFPDRGRGFAELHRVLRPGGCCVVSSWAPMTEVPLIAAAFETLAELVPGPKSSTGFPLADPETCIAEMTAGSFEDVRVLPWSTSLEVPSTEAFVASLERANAPVLLMREHMGEAWLPIGAAWRLRMAERFGDGPQTLTMPAYLTVGRRGGA